MDTQAAASRHGRGAPLPFLLCGLLLAATGLEAAPYVPTDDAEVLEQVPNAPATRELAALRRRVADQPQDLDSAVALAGGYLELGRASADPRYLSYAEATLAPWLRQPAPPPVILVLAATAYQSTHRFAAALELLDRALQAEPGNGQAWLTKATILQVRGEFDAARVACGQTSRSAGQLIAMTCITSVNSMTGKLQPSYDTLRKVYVDDERLPPTIRTWVLGQLAELAERSGDLDAAEQYFLDALAIAPEDVYLKAAYADLLLGQRRYDAVLKLLRGDEAMDNLLLRLAIAGTGFNTREGLQWASLFSHRLAAARRDGDLTHLREQARFLLEVRREPRQALQLAEQNWQVQREPADIRIYAAAIAATGDTAARQRLQAWLQQTGYEDRLVADAAVAAMRQRP